MSAKKLKKSKNVITFGLVGLYVNFVNQQLEIESTLVLQMSVCGINTPLISFLLSDNIGDISSNFIRDTKFF